MKQSLLRRDSFLCLPLKAPRNQINEILIWRLQLLPYSLTAGRVYTSVGILHIPQLAPLIKKLLPPSFVQQPFGRIAQQLHKHAHLLRLALPREYGRPREQLTKYAPETPHIDGSRVVHPQDDLGGSVVAALDVSVDGLVGQAGAAQVD